ncbi:MAG: O-antigen ligase family protein [Planctomycetes bacterium]|nr:O-antigen ligase family protein [Planctomycetota bacterium]
MISEKKILFTKTSINIPVFSFLLCSLGASFYSAHIKNSLETVVHNYLIYFLIFYCMVNTIQNQEQAWRILKAMLITCGLVCAYGLYGYYTGIATRDGRLVATFEYHSRIAKYISLLLPIAVCLFLWYKDIVSRLSLALFVLLCTFSLILTMSRTSWIAILITMLFIGFAVKKKLLMFIVIGVCALLVFILPSKFITHAKTITQVNKLFDSKKILGERLLCWKASIAMIKDSPLLGIGPGKKNFRDAFQQYGGKIKEAEKQMKKEKISGQPKEIKIKKKNLTKKVEKLSHAHNIFLHIWLEMGIVGLLAFLWLFVTVFYSAIKSWRSLKPGYEKILLLGITASLISIFLHGLTDSFWKKPDALFLWYIVGLLFVFIRSISNDNPVTHYSIPNKSIGPSAT